MSQEEDILSVFTIKTSKEVDISQNKRAGFLIFFICLGPLFYGYSLTIIGAANLDLLFSYYDISINKATTQALLNGALPVGGMVGSILYGHLCRLTTKKKYHYYLCISAVVITAVKMVPFFPVLVSCRCLLGFLSAQYMALSMNLIKDHFPQQLWKLCGAFYSAMRILGVLLCYLMGNVIRNFTDSNAGNIFIFFVPVFLSAVQTLMLGYLLPESPVELIRKKQYAEAQKTLAYLFAPKDLEMRVAQLQEKIRRSVPSQFDTIDNPLNVCGLHMALLRQLCGITFLIVYASEIPIHQESSLGSQAIILQNAIQFAGGLVGIVFVNCFPRYYVLTITTIGALLLNLILGIASYLEYETFSFATICLFMFVIGAGITSIVWSYPAQLCTPTWEKYVGLTSMAGTALITIVPPFVVDEIEGGKSYPMFFFFAIYLLIACIINANILPHDFSQMVQSELAKRTFVQ